MDCIVAGAAVSLRRLASARRMDTRTEAGSMPAQTIVKPRAHGIAKLMEAALPTINLPWPPSELHPNSRVDRRRATKHRQAARDAGFYAVKIARAKVPVEAELRLTFCPPDRRRRDLDNLLAACKSALDGMALASGVDDYGWSFCIRRGDPVPGGAVVVTWG